MSGYGGSPDLEAEHALIMSENGIDASRSMLIGEVRKHCLNCEEPIPEPRRQFALKLGHKCLYCIECQDACDKQPKVKMLDWVL